MELLLRMSNPPIPDGKGSHIWLPPTIYTATNDFYKMNVFVDGKLAVRNYPLEMPTKLPKDEKILSNLRQKAEKHGRTIHGQLLWYEMAQELMKLSCCLHPIYHWMKKFQKQREEK